MPNSCSCSQRMVWKQSSLFSLPLPPSWSHPKGTCCRALEPQSTEALQRALHHWTVKETNPGHLVADISLLGWKHHVSIWNYDPEAKMHYCHRDSGTKNSRGGRFLTYHHLPSSAPEEGKSRNYLFTCSLSPAYHNAMEPKEWLGLVASATSQ